MQAPDIAPTGDQDQDDGKVVMVLEIRTQRGLDLTDEPRRLEDVILADYIKREGPLGASDIKVVREMLAHDAHEALDEAGFIEVMAGWLYDDGDCVVVDAGEGPMTYFQENGAVFLATPESAN